jgi:O-antigen/teichoic acid export membrane protein
MGEGLVLHVISKIIFVLTGYAMNMYLGKVLTPAEYGVIGVILSIMNIDYNFLSNGIRQAASSQIAAGRYERRDLIRKSVIYQFLVAVALSLVSIVGADAIASVLNVPDLANDIRITAVTIPFTAMYFISVGIINGFRLFRAETMTMIAYCLMKLTVIPYVGSVFFRKRLRDAGSLSVSGCRRFCAGASPCQEDLREDPGKREEREAEDQFP